MPVAAEEQLLGPTAGQLGKTLMPHQPGQLACDPLVVHAHVAVARDLVGLDAFWAC
jgi:hypothetical protein